MNRRRLLLLAIALVAVTVCAACGPKPAVVEAPTKPKLEKLPADAVLWEGPIPDGVESVALLEKDGVLTKSKEPGEDTSRWWPWSMDQWGLARTDLDTLLGPHAGRTIRVKGHFKKIYEHGTWVYEVEPVKITALADAAK